MNKEQLTYLSQLYNTFCLVNTCGKDTVLMGKCLEAFENFLLEEQKELEGREVNG